VVDFIAGLTYASHGKLTKVGRRAFLLVPDGVDLPADDQRRLSDLGYRVASAGSEA
jgi:cell division inhibitor SepF